MLPRQYVKGGNTLCACGKPRRSGQRTCAKCHADYLNEWRKTHEPTEEQRRKANARSFANVYLRRGKLKKEPCEICSEPEVKMLHEDYDRPLAVRWLCKWHHHAVCVGRLKLTPKEENMKKEDNMEGVRGCSVEGCKNPRREKGRYCKAHHAAAQKSYRDAAKKKKALTGPRECGTL